MSTKHIYVRNNWEELTQQLAAERALVWRIVVGVLILLPLTALILRALPLPVAAATILIHGISFCLFYALVVWYALRHQTGGRQVALGVYFGSLSISVIAVYLTSDYLQGSLQLSRPLSWVGFVGILLFPLNWVLIGTVIHEYRPEFAAAGLALPRSKWHLGYGVLAGCLLAAHFFFTGRLAQLFVPAWKPWPFLLWELSLTVGLRSLSEELFFRGLIFRQLYQVGRSGFWAASAVATVCNVLLYIGIGWQGDLLFLIVVLFYVAALALLNAILYRISDSIAPGIISSTIFHLSMILQ